MGLDGEGFIKKLKALFRAGASADPGMRELLELKYAPLLKHLDRQPGSARASPGGGDRERVYERVYEFFSRHYSNGELAPGKPRPADTAVSGGGPDATLAWSNSDRRYVRTDGAGTATGDRFIHRNLGAYLTGELGFFLNGIVGLEAVEGLSAGALAERVAEAGRVRKIALGIIDHLDRAERFEESLLLGNALVRETQYCITLNRIPAFFLHEVASCDAQRREWTELFGIADQPLSVEFLKRHPTLPVDTKHFSGDFRDRLVCAMGGPDSFISGVLIHGENLQAMRLIGRRYAGRIDCVYIDPPFNTGSDFAYRDTFHDSSWLVMMRDRLDALCRLLSPSGHLFLHLDDNANAYGKLLLKEMFNDVTELIFNTNATRDPESGLFSYKSFGKRFVRQHDTIFHCMRPGAMFNKLWKPNRSESSLGLGQLDLIGVPKVPFARRLGDFRFVVERWKNGRLEQVETDRNGEPVYPLGDLWIDIYSFTQSEMRVSENVSFITQKPEHLIRRVIQATTRPGDTVCDVFGGSGTTGVVAHKLGRRYIVIESGDYFDTTYAAETNRGRVERLGLLGRMKNVLHGDARFRACDKSRRSGLSKAIDWTGGGAFKYLSLEPSGGAPTWERISGGIPDPESFFTGTVRRGKDAGRGRRVDLVETFNWLLGLTVTSISAPEAFSAKRSGEGAGIRLTPSTRGAHRFRTVTGVDQEGKRVLIVWRNLPGHGAPAGRKLDEAVLRAWFAGNAPHPGDFDIIYVNGPARCELPGGKAALRTEDRMRPPA